MTPAASSSYVYPTCAALPGCAPGTLDNHYHTLLSWMATSVSPVVYPPTAVGTNCAAMMQLVRGQVRWAGDIRTATSA